MSTYPKDPDTGHVVWCRCGACEAADRGRNPIPRAEAAEFAPVSRAMDDGRDRYEGRHLAFLEAAEREYALFGPSAEESFNLGAGWHE